MSRHNLPFARHAANEYRDRQYNKYMLTFKCFVVGSLLYILNFHLANLSNNDESKRNEMAIA